MMNRVMADPPWFDLLGRPCPIVLRQRRRCGWRGSFRIGILRTGQPPKLLEMLRWLRRKGESFNH